MRGNRLAAIPDDRVRRHRPTARRVRKDLPAGEIAHVFRQTVFGTLLIWSLYGDDSLADRVHTALEVLWQGLSPRRDSSRSPQGSPHEP